MGFRIVIENEGHKTAHDVPSAGAVLGRDPSCELHFPDQRLSRRHVRFEPAPDGIRLQDLGSRNGCWIDSKRVNETTLRPGVTVRMGGLVLSVERDVPETVVLDAKAVGPESDATIVLPKKQAEASPSEDKTVLLAGKAPAPEHADRRAPASPASSPVADTARQASSKSAQSRSVIPETRILTPDDLAPRPSGPAPGPAPAEVPLAAAAPAPAPAPAPEPEEDGLDEAEARYSWPARFVLVASVLAFVVYFTLAFPLMGTLSSSLREESLRRGRALLDVLAARNEQMVGEGRMRDLSVESVLREERVKEAVLIDLEGKVLAPSSRAGEVLPTIDGIDTSIGDIRTFYLGTRANGDYVLVQPLLYQSRRVGLAVVAYEAATASASFAVATLFLAFLVALVGILVALVVAKRMTLAPIGDLRDDIEAVIKGDSSRVPQGQAFSELVDVARSVNRLVVRAGGKPRAAASLPASPPRSPGADTLRPPPPTPRLSPSLSPSRAHAAGSSAPEAPPPSDAAPSSPPSAARDVPVPPPAPAGAGSDSEVRLWLDESFIVVRTDPGAGVLLGTATEVEGKHLIEAVADQALLEVVLDAVNALERQDSAEGRTATVAAHAARVGGQIVVTLTSV